MIDVNSWLAFVAMVGVLVVSPGPSVLLASSHAMKHGVPATLGTICGDLSANVIQMILASLGLGAIFLASAQVFEGMKWVGVLFLFYLGVQRWRAAPPELRRPHRSRPVSRLTLYWQGFTVSAANPKAVIFFAALFPLFLDAARPLAPQLMVLGGTFILLDGLSLYVYARFADRLNRSLAARGRMRWQNRLTGSLLIGAGVALAFVRRDH